MNATLLTHKPMRLVHRERTVEVLGSGGVAREVVLATYEQTCLCGRVFSGETRMQVQGRYLAHLPKPKPPVEGADHD
jgi:hypothetical protein